jgi:hypothetical protein
MSKKPEDQVYLKVCAWAFRNNFWIHRIESKATFSQKIGRYTNRTPAPKGFPDVCGLGPNGEAVYIELKAKGKLSTIRPEQHRFLSKAISMGAFAVCIDDDKNLDVYYTTWVALMKAWNYSDAKDYLLNKLPLSKREKVI